MKRERKSEMRDEVRKFFFFIKIKDIFLLLPTFVLSSSHPLHFHPLFLLPYPYAFAGILV